MRKPDETGSSGPGRRDSGIPRAGCAARAISFAWIALAVALVVWAGGLLEFGDSDVAQVSYSEFLSQLDSGNVADVTIKGNRLRGNFAAPITVRGESGDSASYRRYVTHVPSFGDDELLDRLEARGVEVSVEPQSDFPWMLFLSSALPILLLVAVGVFIFRRMQAQGRNIFSVGKSKAKLYEAGKAKTTFDDVAGLEQAKMELAEIVEYLKDPDRFRSLGGEAPKGVLLVGPPGTGKTLLARAVAGEADVPFYSITGSDFMEMFVGVGAARVRDLFREAKSTAPSIIFIDELDSIGRRRGAGLGRGHDEREQTLNQLLSELDGFEPSESVIVLAATNRPDILDPALMRPGRFDRRTMVNLPTGSHRLEILELHARDKVLDAEVDLERIARGTQGLSGADLRNLLNEAALIAARKDHEAVRQEDLDEARDKILMGARRSGLALTDEELRMLAYHEAGHAIVAASLPNADPIHKVTIIPRGQAMGATQQLPERDKYIYRKEYMLDRIAVLMGGRAAEQLVFDTAASGAQSDLQQATKLARKMVLNWGMSEKLGPLVSDENRDQVFLGEDLVRRDGFSESTARIVDEELKSILDHAYERAISTLEERRELLDELAQKLLDEEEVDGERVLDLVRGTP